METQASVNPGKQAKLQPVKSRYNRRTAQVPESAKEQPFVQRRVFGTSRNTNISEKVVPEKPKWIKPSLKPTQTTPPPIPIRKPLLSKPSPKPVQPVPNTERVPEVPPKANKPSPKQAKPLQTNIPIPIESPRTNKPSAKPVQTNVPVPIESPKTNKPTPKQAKPIQTNVPVLKGSSPKQALPVQTTVPVQEEIPKTNKPIVKKKKKSVSFAERREGEGTPYHTAERCNKCRFDKMETASYWLAQVRLAESVEKHFVSRALFKLAMECKAESIRSLRAELNRYVLRHRYLSVEPEWRDVTISYGLNITPNDQVEVKSHDDNGDDLDQAREESTENFTGQLESTLKD